MVASFILFLASFKPCLVELLTTHFQFLSNITYIFTLFASTRISKNYKQYYLNSFTKRAQFLRYYSVLIQTTQGQTFFFFFFCQNYKSYSLTLPKIQFSNLSINLFIYVLPLVSVRIALVITTKTT